METSSGRFGVAVCVYLFYGWTTRVRTWDIFIISEVLWPLSYSPLMEDPENFEISQIRLKGGYSASELRVHFVLVGYLCLDSVVKVLRGRRTRSMVPPLPVAAVSITLMMQLKLLIHLL